LKEPGASGAAAARRPRGAGRAWLAVAALALAACGGVRENFEYFDDDDPPLRSVGYVDLDRYMGRWYIVANIPYFAEAGNVAPYVEYSRRPDGLIDDKYTARDSFDLPPFVKDGLIEVTNPITNAEGRITFLPPIWQDFAVVFLDEDYRHTAIAHPSRNYAWVFAREPRMSESVYQAALAALADNGVDITRVLRIPHRRSEQGLPGYQ
jgi:apolipoprotein D and lipocalin family protein